VGIVRGRRRERSPLEARGIDFDPYDTTEVILAPEEQERLDAILGRQVAG
jgi:hypothetical protein